MNALDYKDSKLTFALEGASPSQLKHYDELVHILFKAGVFEIRNGNVILSFDHQGQLQQIKIDFIRWRRDKIG